VESLVDQTSKEISSHLKT